jgi:hypothetical protein
VTVIVATAIEVRDTEGGNRGPADWLIGNFVSLPGQGRYMSVSMVSMVERGWGLTRKLWATLGLTTGLRELVAECRIVQTGHPQSLKGSVACDAMAATAGVWGAADGRVTGLKQPLKWTEEEVAPLLDVRGEAFCALSPKRRQRG